MSAPRPVSGLIGTDAIAFMDHHVIVVRKPAGIATVPFEDEIDTLDRLVHALVRKMNRGGTSVPPLGVVQRLDKETSGLLVFARTATAKQSLKEQLRRHTVHRRYLAVAHGVVKARTIRSNLVRDRGDGYRGSTEDPELGRESITHVRPVEALRGATLVECRLETGRTHQIRIHLSEAGHPLLGDRVYPGQRVGGPRLSVPRLMLHAAELGFVHPATGAEVRFEEPPPADFTSLVAGLRG
jgi:23S rRNA pseudouridine1911/1915/1917 synthase